MSGKSHMLQRWDERERQVYIYNITIYYRDAGPGRPKAPAEVKPLLVEIPASLTVEAGSPQAYSRG
ncbi:MAG: hypothetical protein ACTSP1_13200 [Candidatus Freyarchaeota archaeon]